MREVWVVTIAGRVVGAYTTRILAEQALGDQQGEVTCHPVQESAVVIPSTPPPTGPDRRREMLALYASGVGVSALARRYGISRTAVYNYLKLGEPADLHRLDWDGIAADRRLGMTLKNLAAKYGSSPEYLAKECKRRGITKAQ